MNIAELTRLAERNQLQHEHALLEMFDALHAIDPEVAERTLDVYDGDRLGAATWLANPVMSLGGLTPLQVLAEGRREDVLTVLHQIFYGIYA